MFHLGPPHFQFLPETLVGKSEVDNIKSWGAFLHSLVVRGGGAMVPEARRIVQKPVVQATPQVVQKGGGGGDSRCRVLPEGRERVPGFQDHQLQQEQRPCFPANKRE